MSSSMESCSRNNHFMLKLSRLFPSSSFASCQFRTIPDVADSSITVAKFRKPILDNDNDLSSSSLPNSNSKNVNPNSSAVCKRSPFLRGRDDNENKSYSSRKSDPLKGKPLVDTIRKSTSSYSGWFTSSDEKPRNDAVESDTFFSLSSNSGCGGDSFRLKSSSRRFWEETKRIDEKGSRSFSSVNSSNTAVTKSSKKSIVSSTASGGVAGKNKKSMKTNRPEYEPMMISDQFMISTDQLYYTKNGTAKNNTRKRTAKSRRRSRRTTAPRSTALECNDGAMMKGSYAVEKRSRDPRSDFRASMVEMIVEKHMLGSQDLERLLLSFLSLNSASYHGIIIDVFTEICETLFTN